MLVAVAIGLIAIAAAIQVFLAEVPGEVFG